MRPTAIWCFYLNPRGSTGYGTAFGNAIMKAYPDLAYDDLMLGVNEVIGRGWVDTTRIYVGGCSAGGMLRAWAIGHTNRFAAAAVRCPVTDWLSLAGESDVPLCSQQLVRQAVLGRSLRLAQGLALDVRGECHDADAGDDRRSRHARSGAADRGVLLGAEAARRAVDAAALSGEWHGEAQQPSNWMRTQLYMMGWYGKYTASH